MTKNLTCRPDVFGGLLDDFFGRSPLNLRLTHPAFTGGSASWSPSVDIKETAGEYVVYASLPGMEKKDIHVSVENNVLTLSGERRYDGGAEGEGWVQRESFAGHFHRAFELPANVDASAVTAEHKNGVLEVHLPKTEQAKPRQIDIT